MTVNDFPPHQEQDEALLTKVRVAARGLAPLAEGGVPVLHLQQRPLLNQPLLELQTLIRRSSAGSPPALSLFSLSQIPAGEARHGSH